MVKKNKKTGSMVTYDHSIESDSDFIIFESTSSSEPCWSDDDTDSDSEDSDSEDSDSEESDSEDSDSEDSEESDSEDSEESDSEDSEESDSEDSEESEDSDRGNTDNDTLVVSIKTVSISSSKHVRFSNDTVTHIIEIEDRKGYWTEDRFRFQQRCASVRDAISFIFDEIHRRKMRLIINRSDTLRGVVMTYNPFVFGHIPTCDPKPTIICSNISRGHTTMFASMLAPVQWKRS